MIKVGCNPGRGANISVSPEGNNFIINRWLPRLKTRLDKADGR